LYSIAWTSPAYAVWTVELDTSYTYLTYGQALLVVLCGFGVLFIQPWAIKYGRRLPYVFGSVLIICGLFCGRFMTDVRLYFAYQILAGFGSAPAYLTIITSLLDVSFLHQRGSALALFSLFLIAGNFLPPIAAGYIVDRQGWPWCFNYLLIFFGISFAILLVSAEETGFARETFQAQHTPGVPVTSQIGCPNKQAAAPLCDDKPAKGNPDDPNILNTAVESISGDGSGSAVVVVDTQKLSYREKMTLYRPNTDIKASYWQVALSMFSVATLPAAIWMSLMFSLSSFVVGVVLTTLALFFSAPPYNFSAETIGLMSLPLLIGAAIGSLWGGPFSDRLLILRLTGRRNRNRNRNGAGGGGGGLYEPEYRLWAYLPVPFAGAAGILLYGIGAANGLHWTVPALGLVGIGVYLNASTAIAMGYGLDCYPKLEDEVVQLSNFLRNVLGGAFTFGVQPWIDYSGAQTTIVVIACVVFVANASSVGFQVWGRGIRGRSAGRYSRIRDRARGHGVFG